ncbi:hypothetical protein CEUSTIGMA_g7447.t1 [Chlamydomonas eustigma]|uniref:UPF3 domain-containing protein n=1 Tax=Chlamydomonas eustigma TaxID=1157962 RepID=A0A250XAA1_9CHLO|nr:hypothetical protein CEUSTIGMA_g7447.t1 [Chlamydomonas eustigma]|eukprot:GAX80008.1 hypothetical protein CEUSTIGMA_g7447.t1 [Chlamydomonas eustigma]
MSKLKVAVRRLPPALTEDVFKQTVEKLIEGQYDWFSFFPGKASSKKVVFGRAYINFKSTQAVIAFKLAFDGHVFVGAKGNQYRCSVEYAPYQKIPNSAEKKSVRDGTIVKDPDYIEFLKILEAGPEALPSASAQLEAQEKAAAAAGSTPGSQGALVVTPLMEFIQQKYASNPALKLGQHRGKKKESAVSSSSKQPTSKKLEEPLNNKTASQPQKYVLIKSSDLKSGAAKGVSVSKGNSDPHADDKSSANTRSVRDGNTKASNKGASSSASVAPSAPKVILVVKNGNKGVVQTDSGTAGCKSFSKQDRPESARKAVASNKRAEVPLNASDPQKEAAARRNGKGASNPQTSNRNKEERAEEKNSHQRVAITVPAASNSAAIAAAAAATAAVSASAASTVRQILAKNAANASEDSVAGRKVRTGFQAYVPRSARQETREDVEQG